MQLKISIPALYKSMTISITTRVAARLTTPVPVSNLISILNNTC